MSERRDLERTVADHLDWVGATPLSDTFLDELLDHAGRSGQRPEWLALLKEPPMRIDSRLAVGSPTFRVLATLVATLLVAVALAGAGIAGSRLLAADDTIVVDQSGAGDFTTIAEAVAAASDGHTILVRPGRYVESVVVIGKDLTITGDGDRDTVIIEAALTNPPLAFKPAGADDIVQTTAPVAWAFFLSDTATLVSNLTIVGQVDGQVLPIVGAGAAPVLEDLIVLLPGEPAGNWNTISWNEGAGGVLRRSVVEGFMSIGADATPTIEDNELPRTCVVAWESGANFVIRDNVIHGCPYERGIDIVSTNSVLIEGNDIWVEDYQTSTPGFFSAGRAAIELSGRGPGTITIKDNRLHDSISGILVSDDPPVEIVGNHIYDNVTGVSGIGDRTNLIGNTIEGNTTSGLMVARGAPTLTDNTITGGGAGLVIGRGAQPVLAGNTICENAENVRIVGDAEVDLSGNEVCEDAPASPAG